jgi:hypothetical protein
MSTCWPDGDLDARKIRFVMSGDWHDVARATNDKDGKKSVKWLLIIFIAW